MAVMNNNSQNTQIDEIRQRFSDIFVACVADLIGTKDRLENFTIDMTTVACLLLLIERENEIRAFPGSPPERYNRESFLNDIHDIGIERDEEMMVALQNLSQFGFIKISKDHLYTAGEPAFKLVEVLNKVLPQMPGMSVIAYVNQSINEVISGRNTPQRAADNFKQALKKQGVPLSDADLEIFERPPDPQGAESLSKQDRATSKARRMSHLQQLSKIRKKSLASAKDPAVVTSRPYTNRVEIKELFPQQAPSSPALETPEADDQRPNATESIQQDAESVCEPADKSPPPMDVPGVTEPPTASEADKPEAIPSEDENMAASEPVATAKADIDEVLEPVKTAADEAVDTDALQDPEEEQLLTCPLCSQGKILSEVTQKGKTYYKCSSETCHLISWGKPFPLACPRCQNPFLIEFIQKTERPD